jgi:vesicle-associated membrane protein 7
MISRGTSVLCEYTNSGLTGNFSLLSRKILKQLQKDNNPQPKITYVFEGHTFNFQTLEADQPHKRRSSNSQNSTNSNGSDPSSSGNGSGSGGVVVCMCMCDEKFGRSKPFLYLKDISEAFKLKYPNSTDGVSAALEDISTYKSFEGVLSERMQTINGSTGTDNITLVQKGLEEVKDVMLENMDKVIKRGDTIEVLMGKSENLNSASEKFKRSSTKLQQNLCLANVKFKVIIFCIILLLLYILLASICGPSFSQC